MHSSSVDLVERLKPSVSQVMHISDVTVGSEQLGYAARFRGELIMDSEDAFDRLDPVFAQEGATLMFREEEGQDVVLAISGVIQPKRSNPWINAGLFMLTLASMIFAGSLYGIEGPVGEGLDGVVQAVLGNVPNG
ncbi:MAG: hypothetical protein PVF18_08485, partial [Anaerolineales bacterium]